MWSWCWADMELMWSISWADVELMKSWCGSDVELMLSWWRADVELMKSWFWIDVELMWSWCGADVELMWSWCGALNRENGDLRTEMGTQKLKRSPWGPGPSNGDPWGSSVFSIHVNFRGSPVKWNTVFLATSGHIWSYRVFFFNSLFSVPQSQGDPILSNEGTKRGPFLK